MDVKTRALCFVYTVMLVGVALAEERQQNFDQDPQWDGFNNRAATPPPREVRQDFGYSGTRHAGGDAAGEIGGFLTPAAEPAYYARKIDTATFDDRLTVSGKLACTGQQFHVLVGFFNSETLNEWRVPNSIVLRLYGRGDVFYAYVEYCTGRWRAGGDNPGGFATVVDPASGKRQLRGFASRGKTHRWSLVYDPAGNGARGSIAATIDGETAVCHLDDGHRQDGAKFNRCGLLNIPKHFDTGGEVWLDDLTINGQTETFSRDPGWDARGNRRTYVTEYVRPRFDFGFSNTQFAGGKRRGELGGIVFRGDNRYTDRLAYYGDRLEPLTVDKPLRASGKISLRRGVSDSTSLIGFYHSRDSVAVSDDQSAGFPINFLGAAIEGPSREGFFFYPAYRIPHGAAFGKGDLPRILPDGRPGSWTLAYNPPTAGGAGRLNVTLDGKSAAIEVRADQRRDARFDRFGIVTTWIDGNAQHVYFDDLSYTFRQE
ncbi:MAG: hypothetical protein ACM3U2_11345 [Deltaproteobacteria bacterium]